MTGNPIDDCSRCVPAGNANVRASPTHYGYWIRSDGDDISLYSARVVWVDQQSAGDGGGHSRRVASW
uniref:Uncharacterized protein n=1 Tax=Oryza brachyantha TaxID=4533 RepID=J3KUQ4_ORYBR